MNWVDEFKQLIKCAKDCKSGLVSRALVAKNAGYLDEAEYNEVVGYINDSKLPE